MRVAGRKRKVIVLGGVAAAMMILAALNWQSVALGAAFLFAEKRPSLLNDARWDDPSSATKFRQRFAPGVPESDLISWLTSNDFELGSPGAASKKIAGLPCNELVEVKWSKGLDGHLLEASARVLERGCL